MQSEELRDLVKEILRKKTETQRIELKPALGGFPKIYDTLSSFSNQDEGGIIVFGISEKPKYEIVGVYNPEDVQRKIMEACNQMEPNVRAVLTICDIDDKYIVSAEIPGVEISKRPVFYKGVGKIKGSYIRVGDADEPMNEYEVYNYEAYRKRIHDELRTVDRARQALFDQRRIEEYLTAVKTEHENLSSNVSDEDILEMMGITYNGIPTLAGVMVFSLYPQTFFPQLCITAVSVPGTEIGETGTEGERFIDNLRITGSIPEMLEEAINFIRRNSRTKTIIDDNGRRTDKTEYPIKAIREVVLNALIHRDYSIYTENIPISIVMYNDRIVISNSGGLFGGGSVSLLGKSRPETRNPALANVLEVLRVTENRYSGIPTILHEIKKVNLPTPTFEIKHGDFVVTLRNSILSDESQKHEINAETILEYCNIPRTRKELIDFIGKSQSYAMSKYIKPLIESNKLRLTIPDKPQSSKQKFITVKESDYTWKAL